MLLRLQQKLSFRYYFLFVLCFPVFGLFNDARARYIPKFIANRSYDIIMMGL